ncbi:hypothetical protein [Fonticella tunisiensis]|uniref:Uncharacterized protein n=1 Tax=Fonticella tunisiensis TaxID=1096341 RepID=A0A4R7KCG6_9CLOT|nr:hypothetical protein [Fonticella tunisiensis]TDT51989.1 hypothetical protein EDD71_11520 [Fonticella tunisiensis]
MKDRARVTVYYGSRKMELDISRRMPLGDVKKILDSYFDREDRELSILVNGVETIPQSTLEELNYFKGVIIEFKK